MKRVATVQETTRCLGAIALAIVATCTAAVADDGSTFVFDVTARAIAWVTQQGGAILANAYDKAPVLVAVLAALLILPVTALAALLAQSMRLKAVQEAQRYADSLPRPTTAEPLKAPPAQPDAWLTGADGARLALPTHVGLVRLGRHEDNDIRLAEATVHRHHAVIRRTPAGDLVITDVSGDNGHGVVINGMRLNEGRLSAGDTVQLGEAILTFQSLPPAYVVAMRPTPRTFTESRG